MPRPAAWGGGDEEEPRSRVGRRRRRGRHDADARARAARRQRAHGRSPAEARRHVESDHRACAHARDPRAHRQAPRRSISRARHPQLGLRAALRRRRGQAQRGAARYRFHDASIRATTSCSCIAKARREQYLREYTGAHFGVAPDWNTNCVDVQQDDERRHRDAREQRRAGASALPLSRRLRRAEFARAARRRPRAGRERLQGHAAAKPRRVLERLPRRRRLRPLLRRHRSLRHDREAARRLLSHAAQRPRRSGGPERDARAGVHAAREQALRRRHARRRRLALEVAELRAARAHVPQRPRVPRRRFRAHPFDDGRAGPELLHAGRLQLGLEARVRRQEAGATRRCSTPTRPSAGRSRSR